MCISMCVSKCINSVLCALSHATWSPHSDNSFPFLSSAGFSLSFPVLVGSFNFCLFMICPKIFCCLKFMVLTSFPGTSLRIYLVVLQLAQNMHCMKYPQLLCSSFVQPTKSGIKITTTIKSKTLLLYCCPYTINVVSKKRGGCIPLRYLRIVLKFKFESVFYILVSANNPQCFFILYGQAKPLQKLAVNRILVFFELLLVCPWIAIL